MDTHNPAIAEEEEVLQVLSSILRGELTEEKGGPKVSERSKAAELMGKRYGLFEHKEAEPVSESRAQAVARIEAALACLEAEHGVC